MIALEACLEAFIRQQEDARGVTVPWSLKSPDQYEVLEEHLLRIAPRAYVIKDYPQKVFRQAAQDLPALLGPLHQTMEAYKNNVPGSYHEKAEEAASLVFFQAEPQPWRLLKAGPDLFLLALWQHSHPQEVFPWRVWQEYIFQASRLQQACVAGPLLEVLEAEEAVEAHGLTAVEEALDFILGCPPGAVSRHRKIFENYWLSFLAKAEMEARREEDSWADASQRPDPALLEEAFRAVEEEALSS